MCNLPALKQMFEGVHLIIMTTRNSKSLKRAYKEACAALNTSASLKPSPDHRFAYGIIEAQCVKAALRPLTVLYSDPSTLRAHRDVAGLEECADLLLGTKLLAELLDVTLTALQLLTDAITTLEFDKPMASMALPLWRRRRSVTGFGTCPTQGGANNAFLLAQKPV
jgi:hypothetical protein